MSRFNTLDDKSYAVAEKYYYSIRSRAWERGYNDLNPRDGRDYGDWYKLKIYGSGDDNMLGRYNSADDPSTKPYILTYSLKVANETPCWVIEMWHSLYDEDPGTYQAMINKYAKLHFKKMGKYG